MACVVFDRHGDRLCSELVSHIRMLSAMLLLSPAVRLDSGTIPRPLVSRLRSFKLLLSPEEPSSGPWRWLVQQPTLLNIRIEEIFSGTYKGR